MERGEKIAWRCEETYKKKKKDMHEMLPEELVAEDTARAIVGGLERQRFFCLRVERRVLDQAVDV